MSSAKTLGSRHYVQGGYDYDFCEKIDARYECPICLLCQREPYQTSCGHRFCYSCILTWLHEGKTCPKDNCTLGEGDIFPDSMAHREILQLFVKCPNHSSGCSTTTHLSDIESHLDICSFSSDGSSRRGAERAKRAVHLESLTCSQCGELVEESAMGIRQGAHQDLICPKALIACPFTTIGCTEKIPRQDLASHTQGQIERHMQLLCEKFMKFQQSQVLQGEKVSEVGTELTRTYSGTTLASTQRLLKDLFSRVVRLEQQQREDALEREILKQRVTELQELASSHERADLGRFCQGKYLWRLRDFTTLHAKMRNSHAFVHYSDDFYTSPFGYRLCLRCNLVLQKGEEFLSVFIHIMKGDNDDLLEWPLQGKIVLTVLNQDNERLLREDYSEMIIMQGGLKAYERPMEIRNATGFGLPEFVRVNGLFSGGFVTSANTLAIKAEYHALGQTAESATETESNHIMNRAHTLL